MNNNALGVVDFAVDVVVAHEARGLSVERVVADAAAEAGDVPRALVDLQQKALCDEVAASET